MSVTLGGICPALLTGLEANGIYNPESAKMYVGGLQALHDSRNLAKGRLITGANDDGTGHKKEVRVTHFNRRLASDVSETPNCDIGDESNRIEETINVNEFATINFSVTEDTVRQLCSITSQLETIVGARLPLGQFVQTSLGSGRAAGLVQAAQEIATVWKLQMNALLENISARVLASLEAGKGSWIGNVASKNYQVLNADGGINANGVWRFRQDYQNSGVSELPIIVGGAGPLQTVWGQSTEAFGQAASGVNQAAGVRRNMGIGNFYYDVSAATTLGSDNAAIVFTPGSALYLPFSQYVGNFGMIGTTFRFAMPVPEVPGMFIDVRITPIECNNGSKIDTYAVWLEHYFEVYTAPTNMFLTGDTLEGTNGIFQANFTAGS